MNANARRISTALCAWILAQVWCTTAFASSNDALVRDQSGRIAYIVELDPAAAGAYSKIAVIPSRFPSYARGNVVNLILDIERAVGFQSERMTSWSSTSFTAFLTPKLYDALARDPRVTLITPDVTMSFSSGDVWTDVTAGGETSGWGKQATNKLTTSSNGSTIVYVVDSGIGQHDDLNVVERAVFDASIPAHLPQFPSSAPPTCGSRVGSSCTLQQLTYMTGCYTHSAAVAGIIGAKANNGIGIQGILPNVQIVSVSVTSAATYVPSFTRNCQQPVFTASTLKSALDWVELDLTNNNSGRPAVVNISSNADSTDPGWPAMKSDIQTLVANTSNGHVGAFVVQSAGNNLDEVCNHAYTANLCLPSVADGVMVVGGINSHGQPVVPLNGFPGFWEDYGAFVHDSGSNFGNGVEVWAPAENILTTVSNTSYQSLGTTIYYQDGNIPYSSVGRGSGTSFAAPHIAGLAAYYIETLSLATVQSVETTIRSHLSSLGSFAPSGVTSGVVQQGFQPISIATHDPLPVGTPHSTPYAELILSDHCFAPMFASIPPGSPPGCTQLPKPYPVPGVNIAYSDQDGHGLKIFNFARNNETLARGTGGNPLWVAVDSYGTSSCDLWATPYSAFGPGTSTQLAVAPRYFGANLTGYVVAPSYWLFSSNTCPPARVSMTN